MQTMYEANFIANEHRTYICIRDLKAPLILVIYGKPTWTMRSNTSGKRYVETPKNT